MPSKSQPIVIQVIPGTCPSCGNTPKSNSEGCSQARASTTDQLTPNRLSRGATAHTAPKVTYTGSATKPKKWLRIRQQQQQQLSSSRSASASREQPSLRTPSPIAVPPPEPHPFAPRGQRRRGPQSHSIPRSTPRSFTPGPEFIFNQHPFAPFRSANPHRCSAPRPQFRRTPQGRDGCIVLPIIVPIVVQPQLAFPSRPRPDQYRFAFTRRTSPPRPQSARGSRLHHMCF
jgi:hypothetical protein